VCSGYEEERKKGLKMDFDEPLGKVDYWAELEKQVIDKKQKE